MVPTFQVLANGTATYQFPLAGNQTAPPDMYQPAKTWYQAASPASQTMPAAFQPGQTIPMQPGQTTYTAAVALMPPVDPAVYQSKPAPIDSISMPPAFSNSILQVMQCACKLSPTKLPCALRLSTWAHVPPPWHRRHQMIPGAKASCNWRSRSSCWIPSGLLP